MNIRLDLTKIEGFESLTALDKNGSPAQVTIAEISEFILKVRSEPIPEELVRDIATLFANEQPFPDIAIDELETANKTLRDILKYRQKGILPQ